MRSFAPSRKGLAAVAAGLIAVTGLLGYAESAQAEGGPANKVAAVGTTTEHFDDATPVLSEQLKVSSPADLILSLTAECSIITELSTGGESPDSSSAEGQVEMWITIDGKNVPISSTEGDDGGVVFCNRAYGRTVEDTEGDGDVDAEDDYIRTRTANAFNWLALDTGFNYDDPANGNNILDVVVWADYTASTEGEALANAWVGARSLIIEPTNAAVNESTGTAGE
jgi:hypothetical protein